MFIDSQAMRAFSPVLLARYLIPWIRFKEQINSTIALIIMPCKSLNLEFTDKICAKIELTGCNRRNGPDFGRVFLTSNYTDITQNTYIQSWTVTEILAGEKSGLLWCLRTVLVGEVILPLLELNSYVIVRCSASDLDYGPASKSV